MIAFVEANAPFFTWTGAVFVASVAIGLVLWAVSRLWRWLRELWNQWHRGRCPDCGAWFVPGIFFYPFSDPHPVRVCTKCDRIHEPDLKAVQAKYKAEEA